MIKNTINIVLPVYNEEERIMNGFKILTEYLNKNNDINYFITIVDNASSDKTAEIAKKIVDKSKNAFYKRIETKGVGVAFREAVKDNDCEYIGYMDIDMSTDINTLTKAFNLLKYKGAKIVNATRYSKGSVVIGRSFTRNLISYIWVILLKIFFRMEATDIICGFKFFRKDILEELMAESNDSENGWFYIVELLLRAERKKITIVEIPVVWRYNKNTKVRIVQVVKEYLIGIARLKNEFRNK